LKHLLSFRISHIYNFSVVFKYYRNKYNTNKYDNMERTMATTHTGITVLFLNPRPKGRYPPSLLYANPGFMKWKMENRIRKIITATFTLLYANHFCEKYILFFLYYVSKKIERFITLHIYTISHFQYVVNVKRCNSSRVYLCISKYIVYLSSILFLFFFFFL